MFKKLHLILLLIVICSLFFGCDSSKSNDTIYTYEPTSYVTTYKNPSEDLDINLEQQDSSDNYYTLTYSIKNNSDYSYSYVKVKISLLDESKNVVTSDWTYAVGSLSLEPDERREFDIMIKKPSEEVSYFRWEFIDYD